MDLHIFRLVIRMCIKCADLSHALVDWRQHLDWSLRVVEEFYQQVKSVLILSIMLESYRIMSLLLASGRARSRARPESVTSL